MLEILNRLAQPGAVKKGEISVKEIKEEQCLHDADKKMGGRMRQTDGNQEVYDKLKR